jgi:hypothetical protein
VVRSLFLGTAILASFGTSSSCDGVANTIWWRNVDARPSSQSMHERENELCWPPTFALVSAATCREGGCCGKRSEISHRIFRRSTSEGTCLARRSAKPILDHCEPERRRLAVHICRIQRHDPGVEDSVSWTWRASTTDLTAGALEHGSRTIENTKFNRRGVTELKGAQPTLN